MLTIGRCRQYSDCRPAYNRFSWLPMFWLLSVGVRNGTRYVMKNIERIGTRSKQIIKNNEIWSNWPTPYRIVDFFEGTLWTDEYTLTDWSAVSSAEVGQKIIRHIVPWKTKAWILVSIQPAAVLFPTANSVTDLWKKVSSSHYRHTHENYFQVPSNHMEKQRK